jgi:glucoamylase
LLTGERGHYEIAAGRDPAPYLRALENFAEGVGLIPEQIWDAPDMPSRHLRFGASTDSAVPLLWAHSEYVKLYRSAQDRRVCDLIDPAYKRYVDGRGERREIEIWKFNRQVRSVSAGSLLRIQADLPFLVHWTNDEWRHPIDTRSHATGIGVEYADIPVAEQPTAPIRFTFLWVEENRWEGKDFAVEVHAAKPEARPRESSRQTVSAQKHIARV